MRSPDGEWTARSFDTKQQAARYRRDVERQHAKDDALRRAAELYAQADKVLAEAEALAGGEHTVSAAIEAYERYLRFEKQRTRPAASRPRCTGCVRFSGPSWAHPLPRSERARRKTPTRPGPGRG